MLVLLFPSSGQPPASSPLCAVVFVFCVYALLSRWRRTYLLLSVTVGTFTGCQPFGFFSTLNFLYKLWYRCIFFASSSMKVTDWELLSDKRAGLDWCRSFVKFLFDFVAWFWSTVCVLMMPAPKANTCEIERWRSPNSKVMSLPKILTVRLSLRHTSQCQHSFLDIVRKSNELFTLVVFQLLPWFHFPVVIVCAFNGSAKIFSSFKQPCYVIKCLFIYFARSTLYWSNSFLNLVIYARTGHQQWNKY